MWKTMLIMFVPKVFDVDKMVDKIISYSQVKFSFVDFIVINRLSTGFQQGGVYN